MAFTVVFEGDITKLDFNPMKAETVFGKVIASGIGDAFSVIDGLHDVEDAAQTLLAVIKKHLDGEDEE